MSTGVKDFIVKDSDDSKRIAFLTKEFLIDNEKVEIVSGVRGAANVSRSVEFLKKLGYVTIENISTTTSIVEGRRRTKFTVLVKKTTNFKKLYDENQEVKKSKQNETTTTITTTTK